MWKFKKWNVERVTSYSDNSSGWTEWKTIVNFHSQILQQMESYESESVTLDTFGFPGRFLASGLEYGQFWQGALK